MTNDEYPPGTFGGELQRLREELDALPRWMRLLPSVRRMRRKLTEPDPFRVQENLPTALRGLGLDDAADRVEKSRSEEESNG